MHNCTVLAALKFTEKFECEKNSHETMIGKHLLKIEFLFEFSHSMTTF